jgi:hypothetical protein
MKSARRLGGAALKALEHGRSTRGQAGRFESLLPLQLVSQLHIPFPSIAPRTAVFLGFCRGGLRVGECNDPENRSLEISKSPKLGGGAIQPSSFNTLIFKKIPRAELGAFRQANRPAKGTGEQRIGPAPASEDH